MKILLSDLLLLSLFSSVSSTCQKDCLTCREKLRPALDSFNLEVCILECEGKVLGSPLWTPCTKVMARGSWPLSPADPGHSAPALYQPRASEMHLKRMPRIRSLFQAQKETEPGMDEAGDMEQKQLQKRCPGDPQNSMSAAPDLPAGPQDSFLPTALRHALPPSAPPRVQNHALWLSFPPPTLPHSMFHDNIVATSECIFVIPPANI
ncbi:prepronociceptin [Rhinolophus ferrumequinum]|uniref:Prepronociceptin n=1 Tax=Rhinolophus ferrumequinum TaxID=59479 RepID=A0A7J7U274_RHIFE|nr:prepronociceptin isoform X1 [Rhinolophus ferrumequinum]XP_032990534.1 prepronociceptin isoform X1 [Rhinolophus ferrumequinum]KAF6306926.1 prepronociceptin [Rhinolophus ferrumequinum]